MSRTAAGATAVLLFLCAVSCSDAPPSAEPCGGECPEGQACLDGVCLSVRVVDMAVPEADGEADALPIIDMAPPPRLDAAPMLDAAPEEDAAPLVDAAPDAEPDAEPDAIVDAGCVPEDEICDGVDNDCDESIDESIFAEAGPCMTGFEGVCAAGTWICNNGPRLCTPNRPPAESDACDNQDDDCDGNVDEDGEGLVGDPCDTGGVGACGLGQMRCNLGAYECWGLFQPEDEVCDGADNDCDGELDEDDPQMAEPCETGESGICAPGQMLCHAGEIRCFASRPQEPETCNEFDDDCDGNVDESVLRADEPCDTGEIGACAAGHLVCRGGQLFCDYDTPLRPELCNGIDDDCDGWSDEAFLDLFTDCAVGVGGCRREGRVGCALDESGSVCTASPGAPAPERCNGVDDDCNGEIDDWVEPPEEPDHCGECGRACGIPNAVVRCNDGDCFMVGCRPGWINLDGAAGNGCEMACVVTDPPVERCDGLDNDCDGQVDGDQVCGVEGAFFCTERRERRIPDDVCEPFYPDSLHTHWWSPSLIAAGGDPVDTDGLYGTAGIGPEGGGHTRRISPRVGSFLVSVQVHYRGNRTAVGVFTDGTLYDLDVPHIGRAAAGYVLWIEGEGAGATLTVRRSPEQTLLWQRAVPVLGDGQQHQISWRHLADGTFGMRVDNRVLESDIEPVDDSFADPFERVSLYLGPTEEEAGTLDNLVVQFETDGDDLYPPFDNCPYVYNPDQRDPDVDGLGIACDDFDGDGFENGTDLCAAVYDPTQPDIDLNGVGDRCQHGRRLEFVLDRFNQPQPWQIDLRTGIMGHSPQRRADARNIIIREDGARLWGRGVEIYTADENDEAQVIAVGGIDPDWLGQDVVYLDAQRREVFVRGVGENAGREQRIWATETDEPLYITAGPGPDQVTVMHYAFDVIMARIINRDGETVHGPTRVLPTLDRDVVPDMTVHPSRPLLAFASTTGQLQGAGTVDAVTGAYLRYTAEPAKRVLFTPDGSGLVAVERQGAGWRIVLYDLESTEGVELFGSQGALVPDELAWTGNAEQPLRDDDGDGVDNAADRCQFEPPFFGTDPFMLEVPQTFSQAPRLFGTPEGWALSWREFAPTEEEIGFPPGFCPMCIDYSAVERPLSSKLGRLWSDGRWRQTLTLDTGPHADQRPDNDAWSERPIPQIASNGYSADLIWHHGQYLLLYPTRIGTRNLTSVVRPLSADWTLGAPDVHPVQEQCLGWGRSPTCNVNVSCMANCAALEADNDAMGDPASGEAIYRAGFRSQRYRTDMQADCVTLCGDDAACVERCGGCEGLCASYPIRETFPSHWLRDRDRLWAVFGVGSMFHLLTYLGGHTPIIWPLDTRGARMGPPIHINNQQFEISGDLVMVGDSLLRAGGWTGPSAQKAADEWADWGVKTDLGYGAWREEGMPALGAPRGISIGDAAVTLTSSRLGLFITRFGPGQAGEPVPEIEPVRVNQRSIARHREVIESYVHYDMVWTGEKIGVIWRAAQQGDTDADSVWFRTFDRDLNPLQDEVRLTPPGSVSVQGLREAPANRLPNPKGRMKLAWNGRAFGAVWEHPEGGLQFTTGRFDCQ